MSTNEKEIASTISDKLLYDREAYTYAGWEQGYDGSFEDWLDLSAVEREEYENGAKGIGTV